MSIMRKYMFIKNKKTTTYKHNNTPLSYMLQDGKVTQEEWVQMWSACVRDVSSGKGFPHWQKKYMEFMFRVNDTSG